MAPEAVFHGEYMVESDEGSPLPQLDFDDPDTLTFLDTTKASAIKAPYPTPTFAPLAVPNHFVSPQSLPESRDSLSASSSSSKRTGRSFSAKSTFTTDDVMMGDGGDSKDSWKMSDFINEDEEEELDQAQGDGTIDPSSIENPFQFGTHNSNHIRQPPSASHSPASFGAEQSRFTPEASLSPNQRSPNFSSPCATNDTRSSTKTHAKQYSLTKSMNNLKTNGSREPSPWGDTSGLPDMNNNHDMKDTKAYSSPSPNTNMDLDFFAATGQTAHPAHPGWYPNYNVNPGQMPQNGINGMPFQMPPDMQGRAAFNFHQQQQMQHMATRAPVLKIEGGAAKSRVETQIRIKLILYPLPPAVRRLHLPTHTISKPKLLARPTPPRCPDMLELHTALVCTSAMQDEVLKVKALQRARQSAMSGRLEALPKPGSEEEAEVDPQNGDEVHICANCMNRERKRAGRKKIKKPEDEELWMQDEDRRVVVFNSQEVRDWTPRQQGDGFSVDVQMRIACYCRHHQEKLGFQVIFTITNSRGQFVAQAMSSSIMITDDHKTHNQASNAAANSPENTTMVSAPSVAPDMNSLSPPNLPPYGMSPSKSDSTLLPNNIPFPLKMAPAPPLQAAPVAPAGRLLSRPASPSSLSGPSAKKRKASSSVKVPTGLSMTRLDTDHLVGTSPPHQQVSAPVSSVSATSPFSPHPSLSFPSGADAMFGLTQSMSQPFAPGPPTPNGSEQVLFANAHRPTTYDNTPMGNTPQMYSAPASSHPSRAPSPGTLRNGNNQNGMQAQTAQFNQALANSLFGTLPVAMNAPPAPPSVIHKIIPAEGPKSGGIEVTILGSGFRQGLEVMFGDVRATTTTYWGESSLVCLLPPSPHATTVLVSLKHQSSPATQQFSSKQQPIFKYMDDDEQQLMRTALTVLGHKMNGKVEDISDIARRIIGDMSSNWGQSSSGANGQHGAGPQFNNYALDNTQIESQLLKVLELIDLDDSPHKPRLNLRRSTGQTMLHLACSLGLHRFVAGLLARNANPDVRDKGGYTPLHMAALNDHPEIVRRLITAGADPTLRTLSGLTASDVAQSREVVRAIRRVERHARSRSNGSLPSRTSSLTSLKSLWEPPSAAKPAGADETTSEESETGEESPEYSGEESPEYSSENLVSSDDPDADEGPWVQSRRPSTHASRRTSLDATLQARRPRIQSPAQAVTAFKDQFATQFHQFQQAMALHIQNLAQSPYLPQMPTIPTMSPLADYQAYLNSAAVLQRLSSMVPNIGGSRPGSAGDQPLGKELDGKWWDVSALTAAPAPPPPAYEEIYPQQQGDMDAKTASAAQAAAEAEADEKCATLYDTDTSAVLEEEPTVVASSSSDTTQQQQQQYKLPALLQIGRKNAITKEQQENLQRARAEKLKRLSRDRNLFFIWIPLLLIVLCAMLYSQFPGLFAGIWNFVYHAAAARVVATTNAGTPSSFGQSRVIEVQ